LRYLVATKDYKLTFGARRGTGGSENGVLKAVPYSDVDHANCPDFRTEV
jgi:hypothetical protein